MMQAARAASSLGKGRSTNKEENTRACFICHLPKKCKDLMSSFLRKSLRVIKVFPNSLTHRCLFYPSLTPPTAPCLSILTVS